MARHSGFFVAGVPSADAKKIRGVAAAEAMPRVRIAQRERTVTFMTSYIRPAAWILATAMMTLLGCGDDDNRPAHNFDWGSAGSAGSAGSSNQDKDDDDNDVDGPTCKPNADDGACSVCLNTSCCVEVTACANDSACVAVSECVDACDHGEDEACVEACAPSQSTGWQPYIALLTCVASSCSTSCVDDDEQPGDPPDSCLPGGGEYDESYCGDVPGKPYLYDCPGGAPHSDCELSPTGAANVYCCLF